MAPEDRVIPRSGPLVGLFLASGCSALIYEIVWFQQLSLVLGASAVSLAILLTSFMGGMCLGSIGFSRWVSTRHHPLRVYALLEFLIALCGLATLVLFPVVGRIYCQLALAGPNDLIARSVVALVMLLPPTIMMGATLPAISRWVQSTRDGMAWLGWFYGANTFGAVVGSLFAGMYLLRVHDVYVATWFAASINLAIAFSATLIARSCPCADAGSPLTTTNQEPTAQTEPKVTVATTSSGELEMVYLVAGLSGLTALGAEVIWTRHLGLLLGPTVYTFSIILAVFLLGLGMGSSTGSIIGRRVRSPGLALALTQLLLLIAIPYAAYMIVHVVPYFLARHEIDERFTVRLTHDLVRTLITLLPATFLWGASFPLAVAAAADQVQDPSRLVGRLYAANTLGAIVGSLGISLFAISYGGQFVQQALTVTSGIAGLLMLSSLTWQAWTNWFMSSTSSQSILKPLLGTVSLVLVGVACVAAWVLVPVTPTALLADGRYLKGTDATTTYLYVAEGIDSPIVVSEAFDGTRSFHVAGKIEASTLERDIRTQRLLGHLPAMVHPHPKKILVVGCGSGMTAGSFLLHPTVEEIVLCEMEKCVIEASRDNFARENYGVLRNPKTRVVHDDARHFLATTRETFDVITTDPIHPWVKGAATLYTAEFFQLCRSHLNADGVVTLWVPLYESNEATVKCEMATFLREFPQATIWSGESQHVGYDLVIVGTVADKPLDFSRFIRKLIVNQSLQVSFDDVGLGSIPALLSSYVASGHELQTWLGDAQINRDANLRLQYLAGSSPSDVMEQTILQAMTNGTTKSFDDLLPLLQGAPD